MRTVASLLVTLGVAVAVMGCTTRQQASSGSLNSRPTMSGAAEATDPSCPSSSQLLAAWRGATSNVKQSWAAPTSDISGFTSVRCWNGWVVAAPVGNGNGTFVFSQAGGLHLLSPEELQDFSQTVCASLDSPAGWKNPAAGPADCQ
jgi:hypothetical protein